MDTLIEYLFKEVKTKGIKGIIPILSIMVLTLIFISPSYTFILFFKRSLFLDYKLNINIMTVLILDMILFLVLFVIGSLRNIGVEFNEKEELEFIPKGTISKDVIMTIILMGLVSIVMTLVYSIFFITGLDINTAIGIIILCITLAIIFLIYILTIMTKAILAIWKKGNEKGSNVFIIIIFIIVYCLFLIIIIIKTFICTILGWIFNGKNIKV